MYKTRVRPQNWQTCGCSWDYTKGAWPYGKIRVVKNGLSIVVCENCNRPIYGKGI